jgi:hypothetical protein
VHENRHRLKVALEGGMTTLLPNGSTPRGLCPNGMVRTTGWVQIGHTPISSGLWATLAGFSLTVPFGLPWLSFVTAILGYGAWKSWVLFVRPSSRAVNIDTVAMAELLPGQWFRLYGSAGPAGEVEAVDFDPAGWPHVWLAGGRELTLSPDHRVHRIELRD